MGFEHIRKVFVKNLEPTITLKYYNNHKISVSSVLEHGSKLFDENLEALKH